jgi:hypothetical protein
VAVFADTCCFLVILVSSILNLIARLLNLTPHFVSSIFVTFSQSCVFCTRRNLKKLSLNGGRSNFLSADNATLSRLLRGWCRIRHRLASTVFISPCLFRFFFK